MNRIKSVKEVKVGLDFGKGVTSVGRLAIRERKIYFEYDRSFIEKGVEISPLRLPVKSGVDSFDTTLFEGLVGVFNDSLPDGWGRLLFDRFARSYGILSTDISPLDRLVHIGHRGMGALVYKPDHSIQQKSDDINLDSLAVHVRQVLDGESSTVLQELITLNGSSAGARPKALIGVNSTQDHIVHGIHDLPAVYSPWIVKFANTQDGSDAGVIEYVYALMAKAAGINMPETYLFAAQHCAGYFAIKRFDREGTKRYHMHTACGLLDSDFRTPSLDYEDILALTEVLTRDVREVEKMFQLAVFNVLAHNRDDHSKNFSFLMDKVGEWKLSPAYDLTFSSGPHGEQSTMVLGEGRNPSVEHLVKLGKQANIKSERVRAIIEQTKASLAKWPELAKAHGVSGANIRLVNAKLSSFVFMN